MAKGLAEVPDELCITGSPPDEMLEIRACRKKTDWNPPRTVRYEDNYYRLEACASGMPPRPFRYTLRKLSAGGMGRAVLIYSPEAGPGLAKKKPAWRAASCPRCVHPRTVFLPIPRMPCRPPSP